MTPQQKHFLHFGHLALGALFICLGLFIADSRPGAAHTDYRTVAELESWPDGMSLRDIIIAVGIHLVVPLAGVAAYVWLCRKMKQERVPSPPYKTYFLIFFTLGGWLLVGLTLWLWQVSGLFSLGVAYLFFVSPGVMAVVAFALRQKTALSIYHHRAYQISLSYTVLMVIAAATWFGVIYHQPHKP